jgi:hypothetical protein
VSTPARPAAAAQPSCAARRCARADRAPTARRLLRVDVRPPIDFGRDDYFLFTSRGTLCDAEGNIGRAAFVGAMRTQLRESLIRNGAGAVRALSVTARAPCEPYL